MRPSAVTVTCFLSPASCQLIPTLTTNFLAFGSHYPAHTLYPGLTAYLLDVKVFVWFNPNFGDRYASAPLGVEPQRCLCASRFLTPRNWEFGGA